MEEKEIDMNGYKELANAIILRAVSDYRSTRKSLIKNPNNMFAQADLKRIEKFFLSDWFKVLSDIDGAFILEKLKNEE